MVIDQLGAWVAKQRLGELPADGGFARLQREGTYFQEMVFAHAITETAPGHASLFTGLVPREHGIVANEVLGADGKGKQTIVADASKHKIAINGFVEGVGASLAGLSGSVVADTFRERFGKEGYIAAVSLKDRGAAFGAGKSGNLAIWFDPALSTFVTSDAWSPTLPAWLQPLVGPAAIARLQSEPWVPLDSAWLDKHAKVPDVAPGEGDLAGFGVAFPHIASQSAKPGHAFRTTPRSDRLLLELGLRILDEEAKGRPTFLSISLSANDYIGHVFGPESREAWDELRQLDASLAWFFGQLDQRFGAAGWSVALSADHGVVSLPENTDRACGKDAIRALGPCGKGHRIATSILEERARMVAKAALNDDKAIAGVADPYIYLTRSASSLDIKARQGLARALDRALQKIPGVLKVVDVTRVATPCPGISDESLDALVCRSIRPGVGGDFYVLLSPGAFFDPDLVKEAGTSHGTPYGYDRAVPLFVREPNRPNAAGRVVEERRPFTDYHHALTGMINSAAN